NTGLHLRKRFVLSMWLDFDERAKQITVAQTKLRREQLEELRAQLNAFVFGFDEGIIADDIVLASAIYRHLCSFEQLPLDRMITMVKYIRKNVKHLELLPDENFLENGFVYFLPVDTDIIDKEKVNQHFYDFQATRV
ncbi:unnamed protein product, partial [Didymodactylos carnosus]